MIHSRVKFNMRGLFIHNISVTHVSILESSLSLILVVMRKQCIKHNNSISNKKTKHPATDSEQHQDQ